VVLGTGVAEAERQAKRSLAYLLMNFTGGLFGLLSFAPLAAWKGRRFAFVAYHLGAIVLERRVRQVHSNINQLFHVAP